MANISKDILNRETNARFWAQTGYKPGQKLDPKIPTDKAMMSVWKDIYRKVKAEAAAGTLVTTFDHPAVAQSLSDAAVADAVAAKHADAAALASDPWEVQANTTAAATAAQVAEQKISEAAVLPPTASPEVVEDAANKAAKSPPPPHVPAAHHIAHARASAAASPPRWLIDATNAVFWKVTGYKPGQKLDMTDPQDREMAKVWMTIFHQVQQEIARGGRVPAPPGHRPPSWPPRAAAPPRAPPWHPALPHPAMPSPPMRPPLGPARGTPPEGVPTHATPPAPPVPFAPTSPSDAPLTMPPAPDRPSIMSYLAIGVAVVGIGGLVYYSATRGSAPPPRRSGGRPRAPRAPRAAPRRPRAAPIAPREVLALPEGLE